MLILREVLGFSAREVAEMLDTTVASVNSAMQRARASVEERTPERSQQETLRALGDDAVRALVERYVAAWERGDVDGVVAMLAEDAAFSMPPNAEWYRGREPIRAFLPTGPLSIRRRFVPIRANGQLAFGTYRDWDGADVLQRHPRHHAAPGRRDRATPPRSCSATSTTASGCLQRLDR